MEDTDIAYLAGLIDGEGSIHIELTRGKWYSPRMSLGMTLPALEVMKEFHAEYGGTLRIMRSATDRWAEAWMWYTHGVGTAHLLEDVLPYLRIKREHAVLALKVESIKASLPQRVNGNVKWNETAREQCREIKQQIAQLNRKGPPASAKFAEVA